MYETHFGFHRQPFQAADACRAFFVSESIRTIRPQLLHALRSDLGIAVLTGVPGSGKTSLLRHIQQQLSNEGRAILFSGACLGTSADLISVVQQASRMKAGSENESRTATAASAPPVTRSTILEQTRRTAELWGPVLLLIDDVHLVPLPVLNELRALTEEEWNGRDLLRCLVSAPVSFEEQLARSEYAEFGRRIRCHAFLQPLKSRESIQFLQEQIELAGGQLPEVFTGSALELIAAAADGIPRCLSLLADESLVVAMETGEKPATEQAVRVALGRLQHLQYHWNASPHANTAEEPDEEFSDSLDSGALKYSEESPGTELAIEESPRPIALPKPTASLQKPAQTTLAPGVIEFGGPSAKVRQSVQPKSQLVSEHSQLVLEVAPVLEVTPAREVIPPLSEATVDIDINLPTTEPVTLSAPVSVSTPVAIAFEVGRRFFAESSSDSVSIENVDERGVAELLSLEYGSVENTTDDQIEIDFADEIRWHLEAEVSEESGFSNRTPVFDRYTWIALGREVPSGIDATESENATRDLLLTANHVVDAFGLSTNNSRSTCIDQIPIHQTTDIDLMDQMRRNSLSMETGSFVALTFEPEFELEPLPEFQSRANFGRQPETETSCHTADLPDLRIWEDGQLIFAKSSDKKSPDNVKSDPEPSETSVPRTTLQANSNGFFTLPVPIEKIDWDLRSLEVKEDREVSPIVETLNSLRADVRHFQQTGKTFEIDLNAGDRTSADEFDSLISRAKRRLDHQSTCQDSPVVALQMTPDARVLRSDAGEMEATLQADSSSSSAPRFNRLFTRLWENRRSASKLADSAD